MAETRKCEECGKPYEATRRVQRFCSKACLKENYKTNPPPSMAGAAKKATKKWAPAPATRSIAAPRADVSTPPRPRTPFETFVALNAVVDERRRVAEESIAAAEAAVADFVRVNPQVVDEARAKVERWAAAQVAGGATPPRGAAGSPAAPQHDAGEE